MSFYHGLSENYVHDDENCCYMEMKVSKLYPPDKEHSNVYRYKEVKNRLFLEHSGIFQFVVKLNPLTKHAPCIL